MGQLEKYGLYVLCLVIFLILGVALWGDPAAASDRQQSPSARQASVNVKPELGNFDLNAIIGGSPTIDQPKVVEPAPQPIVDPQPKDEPKPIDAPAPIPAPEERETYTVAPGDSFASISRKRLGSERHVNLLMEANPGVAPERLKPGQKLTLPTLTDVARSSTPAPKQPEPSGSGAVITHEIGKGDTFEGLAVRYLNDRKRVAEIKKLNPTLDPTKLREGQKILIPAK
jgi:LysM repeat protein